MSRDHCKSLYNHLLHRSINNMLSDSMSNVIEAEIVNHQYNHQKQYNSEDELSDGELKRLLNLLPQCFPEEQLLGDKVSVVFSLKSDKKSFWSKVVCAKLLWRDSTLAKKYPASLFMKIPKISQNVKSVDASNGNGDEHNVLVDLTKHEVLWYRKYNNEVIKNFPTPKFFAAEDVTYSGSGIIVTEDLTEMVLSMDYIPGFHLEQVDRLMDALAGFHYHFLTLKDKSWVNEFDRTSTISERLQMLQFNCAKRFETLNTALLGKVEALLGIFSVALAKNAHSSYRDLGIPPVLVHFDLNTTNVLWRKNSSKNNDLMAVIDFQLIHSGNFAEDIARILTMGISLNDRLQYTTRFLKRYHDSLTMRFNGNPPFTLEKVKEAYDHIFLYACNFSLFGLSCYFDMYENLEPDAVKLKLIRSELINRATGVIEEANKRINSS